MRVKVVPSLLRGLAMTARRLQDSCTVRIATVNDAPNAEVRLSLMTVVKRMSGLRGPTQQAQNSRRSPHVGDKLGDNRGVHGRTSMDARLAATQPEQQSQDPHRSHYWRAHRRYL